VRLIIDIARLGNKYFDETQPWLEVKQNKEKAAETLYICAELLRKISIVFSPILPRKMKELRIMMNLPNNTFWDDLAKSFSEINLANIKPLFNKISDKEIEKQEKLLVQRVKKKERKIKHKDEITSDDFAKVEIRVAKIIKAENIKKSNKLTRLIVDLGKEKRQLVAGIAKHYSPDELVDKKVVILVNLNKIKLMGIESNGMILAANTDDDISLLTIDKDIPLGTQIS